MSSLGQSLPFAVICWLLVICLLPTPGQSQCRPTDNTCEFWLHLDHKMTMMYGREAVYAQGGQLYKYNDATASTPLDPTDIITADGWEGPRYVVAVNGSMPGPKIEVWEGQNVVVHVTNKMTSSAATIHWHGIPQEGTPWMDGVAYVTQCPIEPKQTFTYRFKANPKGTYWYHSHIGSQLSMGVVGPFIIRSLQDTPHPEHVLMIMEYNHEKDAELNYAQMLAGTYKNRRKVPGTQSIDGTYFSMFPMHTGLINGRGRFYTQSGANTGAPLTTYSVLQGQTYRFRMIGSGSLYPWRVSIDNHPLTVIATDSYDVVPTMVDAIIINPGERYDFLITANQARGRYWVRAQTLEINVQYHIAEAILEYVGAAGPSGDATSAARICTSQNRCRVLNCPFLFYPVSYNSDCVSVMELKPRVKYEVPGSKPGEEVTDIFLNFAFPGDTWTPGSTNGRAYMHPPVSSLTQPMEITDKCDPDECGEDKICGCPYAITLEHNKVYQMVVMNMGSGRGWSHPIHMHGHTYHVVKLGFPNYDPVTGQVGTDSPDIDCGGKTTDYCNEASWADKSWGGNSVPGLELDSALRKDTLMVPSGGYAVIRIKADNPGVWFMHCHIELHSSDGMAVVLNESYSRHPPPPLGFPVCRDFRYESEEYGWPREQNKAVVVDNGADSDAGKDGMRKEDSGNGGMVKKDEGDADDGAAAGADEDVDKSVKEEKDDDDEGARISWRNFWIVVGVLLGLVVIELVIITVLCTRAARTVVVRRPENSRQPQYNSAYDEK